MLASALGEADPAISLTSGTPRHGAHRVAHLPVDQDAAIRTYSHPGGSKECGLYSPRDCGPGCCSSSQSRRPGYWPGPSPGASSGATAPLGCRGPCSPSATWPAGVAGEVAGRSQRTVKARSPAGRGRLVVVDDTRPRAGRSAPAAYAAAHRAGSSRSAQQWFETSLASARRLQPVRL
jgi:hypothetical protein